MNFLAHLFARMSTRSASVTLALALASSALAGPLSTNHVFERVGQSVSDVAAMLPMPGMARALMLEHDGDLRLTTGDGLVNDLVYHVSVSQTFAGDGLLDGAWHLAAPGQVLFITYIQPTPRKMVVARVEFEKDEVIAFDNLYSVTIPPAASSNLGGGIAMSADGKLYVGIGDMGNPSGAQQPTTLQGKIFRLNSDLPGGIPADNPVSATSPVYATGVRNPVRLTTDAVSGKTYFVDAGPGSNDELNVVDRLANYGWSRFTGVVMTSGFQDPIYVWATPIQPVGLEANTGSNFGPAAVGDLFVAGSTGIITKLHPNPTAPPPSTATETILYQAAGSEARDFADLDIRADGFAYVPRAAGMVYRLKSNAGVIGEPSDDESITPITLKKTAGSLIEFSVEREAAIDSFGLYEGDLAQSWMNFPGSSWYTHPLITTDLRAMDAYLGEAYSKFTLDSSSVPPLSYFIFSGLNSRAETIVGHDSQQAVIPGGNQTFGCPCPAGSSESPNVGNCGPDFVLTEATPGAGHGVEGQTAGVWNLVARMGFPDDYDCDVVLLDLSMEWCGPCRAMAGDAEAIYQDYKDRGFMLIHVLPEDINGNPANLSAAQRWTTDFGLSFPVMYDQNYLVWGFYDTAGAIPQTILLDKEGLVVNHWVGSQSRATLSAAIERELAR